MFFVMLSKLCRRLDTITRRKSRSAFLVKMRIFFFITIATTSVTSAFHLTGRYNDFDAYSNVDYSHDDGSEHYFNESPTHELYVEVGKRGGFFDDLLKPSHQETGMYKNRWSNYANQQNNPLW